MKNRRGFLALLGLAPAAAVLAPKLVDELPKMLHPTGIPFADPPDPPGVLRGKYEPVMRYLGLAQLKNEGDPTSFDPEPDEVERFAKEAFGRKELYEWPDAPEYWEEDEA